jgi:hypothetical protein
VRNPFDFLPSDGWPRFFWPLFGLTVVLMVIFAITGVPMTTEAAPYGVISFELAGSVEQAQKILASWNPDAGQRAAFGLGLDYLFMLVYASTIAFACGMASNVLHREKWPFASLGAWLAWGVFLAALLDVVENIALLKILFGTIASPWPEIARWCAIPKFALIFIGIVYAFYGGVVALVSRITPRG